MVLQKLIGKPNQLLGRFLNIAQKPFLHHTYQRPHIKPCQQIDFAVGCLAVQFHDDPLDRALYDGVNVRLKKAFQMLPAHGVQGAQADRPVLLKVLEQLEQAVLPQHDTLMLPQQRHSLLVEHPAHRVVDIHKVIVKMLPDHAAGLHDLCDGDFVQRLLRHQRFQSGADLPLGGLACLVCPFPHPDNHEPFLQLSILF